jgi:sulfonate transport system substrate-binding protein
MTGGELVGALSKEMTTGLDLKELSEILVQHRNDLYPETVTIDLDAAKRVESALEAGGLIKAAPISLRFSIPLSPGAEPRASKA